MSEANRLAQQVQQLSSSFHALQRRVPLHCVRSTTPRMSSKSKVSLFVFIQTQTYRNTERGYLSPLPVLMTAPSPHALLLCRFCIVVVKACQAFRSLIASGMRQQRLGDWSMESKQKEGATVKALPSEADTEREAKRRTERRQEGKFGTRIVPTSRGNTEANLDS